MPESPTSPSFSPKRRNILVSSLVERISPKNTKGNSHRRQSYDKIVDENPDHEVPLPGGKRTSPVRATAEWRQMFCIDSDDESSDGEDCGEQKLVPELPSLIPLERIPANYICPLTLQLMEDPVQDSCGHTFERRAILEWLDRSNHHEAVCPISRKPLLHLGFGRIPTDRKRDITPSNDLESNHSCTESFSSSPCCYDRVLKRNEGLQQRIQDWKLEHPLYQGVDADYAQRLRRKMLRRNTMEIDTIDDNKNIHHYASIDCPYGGDITDSSSTSDDNRNISHSNRGTSHHRLSRFELMFLPQEREVLKIAKERSRQEQERLDRSRRCVTLISIGFSVFFLIGLYLMVKAKAMASIADGAR